MTRKTIDLVVRLWVTISIVLTSSPLPVLARPMEYADYQDALTETPTVSATTEPTATLPADTATPTPIDTPTGTNTATETMTPTETLPADTATPLPTATPTAIATLTLAPTTTLTPTATATLTPTATPLPYLGLSMQVTPSFVQPGELVTVTLTLSNPQQITLENLVISASLPAGLNYDHPLGEMTPGYNPLLHLLRWLVPANLSGQPNLSLSYVGRVATDAPAGVLSLTAEISSPPGQSVARTELVITAPAIAPIPTSAAQPTRTPAGPPAQVTVVLEPVSLRPGQLATVWVYVTDADGRSVNDGTRVTLQASGGDLPATTVKTREGLARLYLTAGPTIGSGYIAAQVENITGQATFAVVTAKGLAVGESSGSLPFDPAAVMQRVRNRLRVATPGQWVVKNERYAATWSANGPDLTLTEDDAPEGTLGEAAGGTRLAFQLLEVQAGGQTLYRQQGKNVAPVVTDNEARYERAPGLVESYLARDNGLQQMFTLEIPPQREGDLVIRGRFDTPLQPELLSPQEGLIFHLPSTNRKFNEGEGGVLRYTGALVRDARGQEIYAALSLKNRQLSLTVPGVWLARAEYPVVIDPMIGNPALVSNPRDVQGELDVAYNPDTNEYLVVWGGYDTGGASADLEGQRVAADGTLVGGLITIAQAVGDQKLPAVTYNPDNQEYLVLWTDYRADPDGDVYGQRVAANGSLVGGNFAVGATEALQDTPDVAYNLTNDLYLAVWRDRRGEAIYVYGQMIQTNGVLSGTNFAIYNGGGDNYQPRAVYSAANNQFLTVWSKYSSDIYGKRVSGTGALLDNPGTSENEASSTVAFVINNATNSQYDPVVAAEPGGTYLAAWRDNRSDSRGDIYGQVIAADGSLSGGAITLGATASTYQIRPDVAYDPMTQVYQVTWRDDRSGSSDIYGQLIVSTGVLSGANFVVYAGSGTQDYPRVTANTVSGGYLTVWRDWRQESANVYGQRVAGNGAMQGNSFPIGPITGNKQLPWATFNTASREYLLVWEDYRNGNADVYGQRLTEAGQVVGSNFRISDPAASGDQFLPKVAAAGANGYLVTWDDRRSDSSGDIYGQRVLTDGTLAGSNFVVAATAQGQTKPDLAYNPNSGQYLAVWRDQRQDGNGDIYGQLVTGGGVLTGSNFIVSAYGSRTQTDPAVAYNPASGQFLVVWTQYQGSNNYDIYGQQVSNQGALLDNPGTPANEADPAISFQLTTDGLDQEYARPAVAPTGGTYLVVWRDERNYSSSNYDIYGQVLTASGILSGSNVALAVAANEQRIPVVASLSEGQGFLATWDDYRSGASNIYGQQVGSAGGLQGSNQMLTQNVGWITGLAVTGRPDIPEALIAWEWSNEIYAQRYSMLAADFAAAPTIGSAPLAVSFTNISTPTTEITGYLWNFGNGITSTAAAPVYTYTQPGVYTVTLTVSGPAGSNTKTRMAYITVNSPFSPTSDLRGYWRLDEATGLRYDQSGYGYHLTPVSDVSWVEAGYIGSAVDVEKDNLSYLVLSNTVQSGLAISSSLTLMGWVKPESSSSNYMMLAAKYRWYLGQQEDAGYRLSLDGSNRLQMIVSPDGTYQSGYMLNGTTTLITNTWHHVAAVFDTQAREMRVYVNGVLDGSKAVNYNQLHLSSAPFMLGADLDSAGSPTQHFDGRLDEWRVYARALSQAEIQSLLNRPGAAFRATPVSGMAPLTVTFANSSTNATSLLWNFGDGYTQTLASPLLSITHTYTQPGFYTVTLTAAGSGGSDVLTRPAYINTYPATLLMRAFAFGADAWTRASYNQSAMNYVKVAQDGQNFIYSASQGYGYIDTADIDATPNNRGVYNDADEIYDQLIGVKYSGDIIFRIDVPNGRYRFVAAGGDASNYNHSTTIQAQDGATGQVLTLVSNYQPAAAGRFWTVGFAGKVVPPADGLGADPIFVPQSESGVLEVTQGYLRLIQRVGTGSTTGGDLSLLEVWRDTPAANFTATPLTGTAPLTVTFANSSTNATAYLWQYGDGITSTTTGLTHTHAYTQAGVYTVTLAASGSSGSNTLTKTNYITVSPALKADFSAFPYSGTAPALIQFLNNSTGNISAYLWRFGDGLTSMLANPTHTYTATGVYTVSLTVSGLNGSDTLTQPNYITMTQTTVALFSATPLSGTAPLPVTFANSSTNATSYLWQYGDGITSTTTALTHTYFYTRTGVYTVSLTANGPGGSDTLTKPNQITVTDVMTVEFKATPVWGMAPLTVTFFNQAEGLYDHYLWQYGDGITETTSALTHTHTYNQAGVYTVTLTVNQEAKGQSKTLTKTNYIEVAEPVIDTETISGTGGMFSTADGELSIEFAPGAVTETLEIWIARTDIAGKKPLETGGSVYQDIPDGGPFVLFDLAARRPGETESIPLHFQAPVTLTYTYAPTQTRELFEDSLTFMYYDPDLETMAPISTTVHTQTLQVTAPIFHFSTYGVAGDKANWSSPTIDAFSVALTRGGASYSYDIPVPAGPNGLAPKLTLQYSTGLANSPARGASDGTRHRRADVDWVGLDWVFELGNITSNYGDDKTSYQITLNGLSEEFKEGAGRTAGFYYTNHANFMRIQKYETQAVGRTGPSSGWIVTAKDGTTYYFGTDTDGNGSTVSVYNGYRDQFCYFLRDIYKLFRVVDVHGNTMNIQYETIPNTVKCGQEYKPWNQSFPISIRYTTNTRNGDNHAEYVIEFVRANNRLTAIKSWYMPTGGSPQQLIRTLNLGYDPTLGLLNSLEITAGANQALPKTTFEYTEKTIGEAWQGLACFGPPRGGAGGGSETNCGWYPFKALYQRHFLSKINNSYGGVVELEYQPETHSGYQLFQVAQTRRVSDTITGLTSVYQYQFAGPNFVPLNGDIFNPGGFVGRLSFDRFFGFSQATATDPLENVVQHYYDNSYDPSQQETGLLNGYELETRAYGFDQKLYSVSKPSWVVQGSFIYNADQRDYLCDGQPPANPTPPYDRNQYNLNLCIHKRVHSDYDLTRGALTGKQEFDDSGLLYRSTVIAYTPRNQDSAWLLELPQTQTAYDAAGHRLAETRYHYDNQPYGAIATEGNLTAQRVWAGDDHYLDTVYADYDNYGNARRSVTYNSYGTSGSLATDNPRPTTTEYGDHGLLPVRVTNPLGQVISKTYTYLFQFPLSETDPNGALTTYQYDDFGRLKQVWLPAGSGDNQATFKADYFDTVSPYKEVIQQRLNCAGSEQEQYAATHVFYDGLGRKIQAHGQGDAANSFIVSNVKYDELGRLKWAGTPYNGSGTFGEYHQAPDWNHGYTATDYDPLGRTIKATQSDGSVASIFYNGYKTTAIDPNGHQQISEKDAFGRLIKVWEFLENQSGDPYFSGETRYVYDPLDHLTGVTDADGNQTTITYDSLGRKTGMNDPDMSHWSYGYDAQGNMVRQTDARGITTTLTYDDLNRPTGKSYSNGDSTVSYTYDEGVGQKGRRTSMTDQAGSVSWSYDARGRVLNETRLFATAPYSLVLKNKLNPQGAYVTSFTYNQADSMTSTTYPDGEVVTTTYTQRSLASQLSSSLGAQYVTGVAYNALANPTGRTTGNGLTASYDYFAKDNNYRLKQLKIQPPAGANLLDVAYQYDLVGNITCITDIVQSQVVAQKFTYDALNRLTGAEPVGIQFTGLSYTEWYAYNAIGNLTENTGRIYIYPNAGSARPHAVLAVDNNTYQYDANGNMTMRLENGVAYTQTWTAENKLKGVEWVENGQPYITRFVYDGDGNRLLKVEQLPTALTQAEITTVYIGQIYEEQFDTTASGLLAVRADLPNFQNFGSLSAVGPSALSLQPSFLRPPGLAAPLLQTSQVVAVSNQGDEQYPSNWPSYNGNNFQDIPDSWVFGTGGGWKTELSISISPPNTRGWHYNTATCSLNSWAPLPRGAAIPPGSTILGPCSDDGNPTHLHRDLFTLTQLGPNYVPQVWLEVWSDNGSRWYVNGAAVGDWGGGTGYGTWNITNYTHLGQNLLAVQMGNTGNLKGTAWRVRVEWTYTDPPTAPAFTREINGFTAGPAKTLQWASCADAESYELQQATNISFTQNVTTAQTTTTSYTFTGLSHNQTYYYHARSLASWGRASSWSAPAVFSTQDAVSPVATMTLPVTATQTSRDITLSWSGSDDGSGVQKYDVHKQDNGAWSLWRSVVTTTTLTFTGDFSHTYAFRVQPKDNAGNLGNWATSPGAVTIVLPGTDITAPVVSIVVPAQAPLRFGVTWQGSDAESGVSNYEVEYKDGGSGSWTPWLTQTTQTTAPFVGQEGHTYTFQARATDNVGNTGNWATSSSVEIVSVTKYYYFGSSRIAMRQGTAVYYLHGDHLGSVSLTTDQSGALVSQSRYLPYGQERWSSGGAAVTDFGFTGQRKDAYIKLSHMGARWYDAQLGRFISPDTIIPDPTNPQSFNRYSYASNNPLRYIDPSGHCIVEYSGEVRMNEGPYGTSGLCPNTKDWITEGEAAINEYHEKLEKELSAEPNYPINGDGAGECQSSLSDCFGDKVTLKDFSGHGKDNPIPIDEFTEFADKVAADLYLHDLTWPGVAAGRGEYDTPFYNGGNSFNPAGKWPSNQQVCIETLGCSGRSEINYLAQGMWGAATGETPPVSEAIATTWKVKEYVELPSEGTLKWLRWGYEYYQRYREEHPGQSHHINFW